MYVRRRPRLQPRRRATARVRHRRAAALRTHERVLAAAGLPGVVVFGSRPVSMLVTTSRRLRVAAVDHFGVRAVGDAEAERTDLSCLLTHSQARPRVSTSAAGRTANRSWWRRSSSTACWRRGRSARRGSAFCATVAAGRLPPCRLRLPALPRPPPGLAAAAPPPPAAAAAVPPCARAPASAPRSARALRASSPPGAPPSASGALRASCSDRSRRGRRRRRSRRGRRRRDSRPPIPDPGAAADRPAAAPGRAAARPARGLRGLRCRRCARAGVR